MNYWGEFGNARVSTGTVRHCSVIVIANRSLYTVVDCRRPSLASLRSLNPVSVTNYYATSHPHCPSYEFSAVVLRLAFSVFFPFPNFFSACEVTRCRYTPVVTYLDGQDILMETLHCMHVQLMPASCLRRAALQALLKKIHDAKEQKMFGRQLFTSVIEPAVTSGAGSSISAAVRNMLWYVR